LPQSVEARPRMMVPWPAFVGSLIPDKGKPAVRRGRKVMGPPGASPGT